MPYFPLMRALALKCLALLLISATAQAQKLRDVDILILGDSQLAFGSGPAFESFFGNFAKRCDGLGLPPEHLEQVEAMAFGILGIRATGLGMWLAKSAKATRMVCVKDPSGFVNASTYGAMRYGHNRWAQIGESRYYQFCGNGRSPFANIMAKLPEPPRLVILHFLALSTRDWINDRKLARDLDGLDTQLPKDSACLFLTTIPAYRPKLNRPRLMAQDNLEMTLKDRNHRCGFVAGQTPDTLKAFQNNPAYYYKHRNGKVRDPFHTTPAGAERFLEIRGPAICRGVVNALWPDERSGPEQISATTGAAN